MDRLRIIVRHAPESDDVTVSSLAGVGRRAENRRGGWIDWMGENEGIEVGWLMA